MTMLALWRGKRRAGSTTETSSQTGIELPHRKNGNRSPCDQPRQRGPVLFADLLHCFVAEEDVCYTELLPQLLALPVLC
jgi:hypothetical protein